MNFSMHRLVSLFAITLTLVGCATDKYPYPPQFVSIEQVPATVLPKPPAIGSAAYNKGMDFVLARQKKLTPETIALLKAEDHISPEMILVPVLGSQAMPEQLPATYALLRHAGSDAWRIGDNAQNYWKSPRPWYADDRVALHVGTIKRPGYPSGHTTTNHVWAYVLGDALPCKKSAFLKRANDIGYHRVDAGAHFPFDVEAGKKLAPIIYGKMKQSPQYQAMLGEARKELLSTTALSSNVVKCRASR
jgi:acid phosphatase (class A)